MNKYFVTQNITELQNQRRGCDWMKCLTTYLVFKRQLEGI